MRRSLLLLLAWTAAAEEPEPGIVPKDLAPPDPLEIAATEGDPLATFRDAHERHKKGDLDGALQGYLAFLGNPQRMDLPARYTATVEARVKPLLLAARALYDAAVGKYEKDRKGGLADLRALAERYPWLPEGRAALAFADSDGLREAITAAKKGKDAKELEAAIRRFPHGLYRYEAKTLLVDLGGPDLFEPSERLGGGKGMGAGEGEEPKPKAKDESGIDVSKD